MPSSWLWSWYPYDLVIVVSSSLLSLSFPSRLRDNVVLPPVPHKLEYLYHMVRQCISDRCYCQLYLTKDAFKLCRHCRYRESIKSHLSKWWKVTCIPPLKQVLLLPIDECRNTSFSIVLKFIVMLLLEVCLLELIDKWVDKSLRWLRLNIR